MGLICAMAHRRRMQANSQDSPPTCREQCIDELVRREGRGVRISHARGEGEVAAFICAEAYACAAGKGNQQRRAGTRKDAGRRQRLLLPQETMKP